MPDDWEYIEYDGDTQPEDEAFEVDDEDTLTLAYLEKTDLAFFTVFAAELDDDEDVFDYILSIRTDIDEDDLQYQTATVDGQTAYLVFYQQEEEGERGGDIVDLYLSMEGIVLWARGELTGTNEERNDAWDEFWDIYQSAEIE